ncbi:MAG: hypothetical protein R6T96_05220 [Longimicrobiales bacterium]
MKRDLLAAFTFILTGILFYSVGSDADGMDRGSPLVECGEGQMVIITASGTGSEAPKEVSFLDEGTRDS